MSRLADGREDCARQAQTRDELVIPRARARVHERRRRSVGVLVGDLARQDVTQVVGNHEECLGALELLGVLALVRHELIGGVEALELDARALVMLRERDGARALELLADALRAPVAIGDRIADALALLVEQHIVDRPRVDAHRVGRQPLLVRSGEPLDHVLGERIDIPAEMPVLLDERVVEAVDLGQPDLAVYHLAHDMTPA